MQPYYEDAKSGISIYCGDCREIVHQLPPVECVFTSPPYLNQRDYGGRSFEWDAVVPPAIASVNLAPAGQVFVNLGLVHRERRVVEYWRPLMDAMDLRGLPLFGWYVWDQGDGLPGDWAGRLAPSFEFVFHFSGECRQPHKTEPCKLAGRKESGKTFRRLGGVLEPFAERTSTISQAKIPDSVVRVQRLNARHATEHPAAFPTKLPSKFIAAYTNEGDTVLDMFGGSGTTMRACKDLGRKGIMVELEERYCEIAANRLSQGVLQFSA